MNIVLEIKENDSILWVKDKNIVVDEIKWNGNLNLSEELLGKIDSILAKNNLKPSNIDKVVVKSDISDNLTTVRIAKIVAKTFNFSKSVD